MHTEEGDVDFLTNTLGSPEDEPVSALLPANLRKRKPDDLSVVARKMRNSKSYYYYYYAIRCATTTTIHLY